MINEKHGFLRPNLIRGRYFKHFKCKISDHINKVDVLSILKVFKLYEWFSHACESTEKEDFKNSIDKDNFLKKPEHLQSHNR